MPQGPKHLIMARITAARAGAAGGFAMLVDIYILHQGRGHTPELPRRWLSTRCVSMMPVASIRACMVVGPTNEKPRWRRALLSAVDASDTVGISASVRGAGVAAGWNDQMKSASPPSRRRAIVAAALLRVARILARHIGRASCRERVCQSV